MPDWFLDWSGWAFGLFGVLAVIFGWAKFKKKTTNTITQGDGNIQSGGEGETVNRVEKGDNNQQSG